MEKIFLKQEGKGVVSESTLLRGVDILNNETLFLENNKVWIKGIISDEFKFYRTDDNGEAYFRNTISINRISGNCDDIQIVIPQNLMKLEGQIIGLGEKVEICGEYNSRNFIGEDKKSHLDLFITVTAIRRLFKNSDITINNIFLDGYICKPVVGRYTPLGKKIADITIAVNYDSKESSYIPCIAWANDADFAEKLKVGERIKIFGRIQSREYIKRYEGLNLLKTPKKKIVNEISIKYIGVVFKKEKLLQMAE